MLITSDDVLNTIGIKLKQARLEKKYTQDYVAENTGISTDLLRNIENSRNIGSVPTLLNLCNFLQISPNALFSDLLTFEEKNLDTDLRNYFNSISDENKEVLKNIILHIDRNY